VITRILVATRDEGSYYRRFYVRRGLRIWPLYYLYLVITTVCVVAVQHTPGLRSLVNSLSPLKIVTPLPMYLVFFQNLYRPSLFCFRDFMAITWSLCIEEHFYLAWPVMVRRFPLSTLKVVLATVLLVSPFLRLGSWFLLRDQPYEIFYQTITRFTLLHLDAICAGCLLSLFWNDLKDVSRYKRLFAALFIAGLAGSAFTYIATNGYVFAFCYSALAVMFSGLVGLALLGWQDKLFTNPALRYVGKISYGIYLIHPVVFEVFQSHTMFRKVGLERHTYIAEILAATLAIIISFLVASISWKFLESPILRLKTRLQANHGRDGRGGVMDRVSARVTF